MTGIGVLIFGALGAGLRYSADLLTEKVNGVFPVSTFAVNFVGCLLVGFFYALGVEKNLLPAPYRPMVFAGFLGGFTTFSAYALQSLTLFESGRVALAATYFIGSPVVGLAAAALGLWLARMAFF